MCLHFALLHFAFQKSHHFAWSDKLRSSHKHMHVTALTALHLLRKQRTQVKPLHGHRSFPHVSQLSTCIRHSKFYILLWRARWERKNTFLWRYRQVVARWHFYFPFTMGLSQKNEVFSRDRNVKQQTDMGQDMGFAVPLLFHCLINTKSSLPPSRSYTA